MQEKNLKTEKENKKKKNSTEWKKGMMEKNEKSISALENKFRQRNVHAMRIPRWRIPWRKERE